MWSTSCLDCYGLIVIDKMRIVCYDIATVIEIYIKSKTLESVVSIADINTRVTRRAKIYAPETKTRIRSGRSAG